MLFHCTSGFFLLTFSSYVESCFLSLFLFKCSFCSSMCNCFCFLFFFFAFVFEVIIALFFSSGVQFFGFIQIIRCVTFWTPVSLVLRFFEV
jgi:hypothetical protein